MKDQKQSEYEVALYRRNGRFVKSAVRPSKYAAKQLRDAWEDKYDDGYYVEVTRIPNDG